MMKPAQKANYTTGGGHIPSSLVQYAQPLCQ